MSRVELVDPTAGLFVSLERVLMSIFRYLKQLVNELPQPADVPSVPASTMLWLIIPWSQHSPKKKRRSSYNRYSYGTNRT